MRHEIWKKKLDIEKMICFKIKNKIREIKLKKHLKQNLWGWTNLVLCVFSLLSNFSKFICSSENLGLHRELANFNKSHKQKYQSICLINHLIYYPIWVLDLMWIIFKLYYLKPNFSLGLVQFEAAFLTHAERLLLQFESLSTVIVFERTTFTTTLL